MQSRFLHQHKRDVYNSSMSFGHGCTVTEKLTKKINKRPVVLIGKTYWQGLVDWIEASMLNQEQNVSANDLSLFRMVDTAQEAFDYIDDFYKTHELSPNF